MLRTTYRGRRAARIENDKLRVTILEEGGHIAELLHVGTHVNPLWTPPWPSIEPSTYDAARHPEYGADAESKLLSGIMGHNLCLDLFGGPSEAEAKAGVTVHGEASVAAYRITETDGGMRQECTLPIAQLAFSRVLTLAGDTLSISETVENLSGSDRPIAWTQHVTLGPPFVERGKTKLLLPGTRSRTFESDFTGGKGRFAIAANFDWPNVPTIDGRTIDLQTYPDSRVSAGYTAHLLDPHREKAFFEASNLGVTLRYEWTRSDFPWTGIWEENHCRENPPWNGKTMTRGVEFGVSPFPESRRAMIDRKELFGVPCYRWIPARSRITVQYSASLRETR